MKPSNFRQAQKEVHKIMHDMGQEPAQFDGKHTKRRRLSLEQLLALSLLFVILIMVLYTASTIALDAWQKGLLF